jgi:hypothetical protein
MDIVKTTAMVNGNVNANFGGLEHFAINVSVERLFKHFSSAQCLFL